MSRNLVLSLVCTLSFLFGRSVVVADSANEKLLPLEFLVGVWKAEYEVPAPIPEIGADRGSKASQTLTVNWILDGAAIEMRIETTIDGKPQPPSKEIIAWDPKKKSIAHVIVDGSGFLGGGSWRRDGGDWLLDWNVATEAGGYEGVSIHRPKNDSSFEWQMINVSQAGKKLPDWPLVEFKRVRAVHETWLDYMKGSWDFEFADGRIGVVTWIPVGDTPALTFTAETDGFSIAGVIGWHEDQEVFLETDFVNDAGVNGHLQRTFGEVSSSALTGTQTWWDAAIGRGGQELAYRRVSEDEMTLTGKASDSGGEDWIVRFKRKS